jgi:hypothetical protein
MPPIGLTDILESLGDFPIVEDIDFKGGYRAVADVTARNAIPASARKVGMLVRTVATNEVWVLGPGITNSDWTSSNTAVTAKDEGTVLTTSASSFDFVGAGVTMTSLGNEITVTVPGFMGSTGVGYQPMAIDEGTDVRLTEITVGGIYFDPSSFTTDVDPVVTFRLMGSYASTDIGGNAQVRLYDMGPGSGPFVPVLRSTLTIPFANVDDFVKVDQVLSLVASPGVSLNEIHLTARAYELRMYLNTTDVGSTFNIAWSGFEVVGGAVGSSTLIAKNEGTVLTTSLTSIDFTGAGVNVTNLGGAVTVDVSIAGFSYGSPVDVTKAASSDGVSAAVARADHKHDVATAAPATGIGGSNSEGSSSSLARADHNHKLRTTTGPTDLDIGAVADGEYLKRLGAQVVGITVGPGTGGNIIDRRTVTGPATVSLLTTDHVILVNTTGGVVTLTLPDPGLTDRIYEIKDIAGTFGTNACIIARNNAGDQIEGIASDYSMEANWQSLRIGSNSISKWYFL